MSLDAKTSLGSTKRRLNDLQTFQLPRLEKCNGPLTLHRELGEEMKVDLESVRRSLEMTRELAHGHEDDHEILGEVEKIEEELKELRMAYRAALITSKKAITSKARSRRHELILKAEDDDGSSSSTKLKAQARVGTSEDDALQTKTNEVTDALRRTTTLMQAELEKSVLSVQMLDESTRTLNLTQALYDNYTSLLTTSTHLVKAIERADWYDRLLIFAAFAFFLLVVGWVIKRRVFDKVVGGVGWYVGGSWKLVRMGFGGKKGVSPAKAVTSVGQKGISITEKGASIASAVGTVVTGVQEAASNNIISIATQAASDLPPEPSILHSISDTIRDEL